MYMYVYVYTPTTAYIFKMVLHFCLLLQNMFLFRKNDLSLWEKNTNAKTTLPDQTATLPDLTVTLPDRMERHFFTTVFYVFFFPRNDHFFSCLE